MSGGEVNPLQLCLVLFCQVMSRHDNLHRHLGHLQQAMGFPGTLNPDPRMELQFNMLFKRKMAAEIAILVSHPAVSTHLRLLD